MTQSKRQPYGFGSFVKKFTKPIKKIVKSPLGKAALLGGLGWGAHKGMLPGGFGTGWGSKLAGALGNKEGILAQLFRKKLKDDTYGGVSLGKLALLGLGGAGLMGMGPLSGLGGIGAKIGGGLSGFLGKAGMMRPGQGFGGGSGLMGFLSKLIHLKKL